MFGGRKLGTIPAICLGLLAVCGKLRAEAPLQFPASPVSRSAKVHETSEPKASKTFYFGVMGQFAHPGVYELETPEPQLMDLIRHAGGLTQQATNRIRIVRRGNTGQNVFYSPTLKFQLAAGDILVADGPREYGMPHRSAPLPRSIQPAVYTETPSSEPPTHRQVALVGVLDRPVVLRVPQTHANVPAILAYLGQATTLSSTVKVLPVGRPPVRSTKEKAVQENFVVPTVLYFSKGSIQAHNLPELPEVYRIRPNAPAPSVSSEDRRTAENIPASPPPLTIPLVQPTPIERFRRPEPPHSDVTFPSLPANNGTEPPLIAEVRDLENRIPDPVPIVPSKESKKTLDVSAKQPTKDRKSVEQTSESSAWPYVVMVFVALVAAGSYAMLRWSRKRPDSNVEQSIDGEVAAEEKPDTSTPTPSHETIVTAPQSETGMPSATGTGALVPEEVLQALLYNQIPVREEPVESPLEQPESDKPKPQKIYRVDPPAQQAVPNVPKPFFLKRPKPQSSSASESPPVSQFPEPAQEVSVKNPTGEVDQSKDTPEVTTQLSLLDRVLQQVNQPRAA